MTSRLIKVHYCRLGIRSNWWEETKVERETDRETEREREREREREIG